MKKFLLGFTAVIMFISGSLTVFADDSAKSKFFEFAEKQILDVEPISLYGPSGWAKRSYSGEIRYAIESSEFPFLSGELISLKVDRDIENDVSRYYSNGDLTTNTILGNMFNRMDTYISGDNIYINMPGLFEEYILLDEETSEEFWEFFGFVNEISDTMALTNPLAENYTGIILKSGIGLIENLTQLNESSFSKASNIMINGKSVSGYSMSLKSHDLEALLRNIGKVYLDGSNEMETSTPDNSIGSYLIEEYLGGLSYIGKELAEIEVSEDISAVVRVYYKDNVFKRTALDITDGEDTITFTLDELASNTFRFILDYDNIKTEIIIEISDNEGVHTESIKAAITENGIRKEVLFVDFTLDNNKKTDNLSLVVRIDDSYYYSEEEEYKTGKITGTYINTDDLFHMDIKIFAEGDFSEDDNFECYITYKLQPLKAPLPKEPEGTILKLEDVLEDEEFMSKLEEA